MARGFPEDGRELFGRSRSLISPLNAVRSIPYSVKSHRSPPGDLCLRSGACSFSVDFTIPKGAPDLAPVRISLPPERGELPLLRAATLGSL